MSHHHLSTNERGRIQELLALGFSHREIAKRLDRHHSCIDREVLWNQENGEYTGEAAQAAYDERRQSSKPKGKCSKEVANIITEKLLTTWSPEQIANTVLKGIVSFKSIYRWMYSGKLSTVTTQNLRHKGKRGKAEKRGKFSMGAPISERPKEVKNREVPC